MFVARPAIEPIYFSLPATWHISLTSFRHFIFLLHIRLSPLGTPYAIDIIPETCQAGVQLAPGLIPVLPRTSIAIILLVTFSSTTTDVTTRQSVHLDPNFFDSTHPGKLTVYAKGVLIAFTVYVGIRTLLVISSGLGLWLFSRHPFGTFGRPEKDIIIQQPDRPQITETVSPRRDPAMTRHATCPGMSDENHFQWDWRERSRSRIQDAYELCMIRRQNDVSSAVLEGESNISQRAPRPHEDSLPISKHIMQTQSDDIPRRRRHDQVPGSNSGMRFPYEEVPRPEPFLELSRPEETVSQAGTSTSTLDTFHTPMSRNNPEYEPDTPCPPQIITTPPSLGPETTLSEQSSERETSIPLANKMMNRQSAEAKNSGTIDAIDFDEAGIHDPYFAYERTTVTPLNHILLSPRSKSTGILKPLGTRARNQIIRRIKSGPTLLHPN